MTEATVLSPAGEHRTDRNAAGAGGDAVVCVCLAGGGGGPHAPFWGRHRPGPSPETPVYPGTNPVWDVPRRAGTLPHGSPFLMAAAHLPPPSPEPPGETASSLESWVCWNETLPGVLFGRHLGQCLEVFAIRENKPGLPERGHVPSPGDQVAARGGM